MNEKKVVINRELMQDMANIVELMAIMAFTLVEAEEKKITCADVIASNHGLDLYHRYMENRSAGEGGGMAAYHAIMSFAIEESKKRRLAADPCFGWQERLMIALGKNSVRALALKLMEPYNSFKNQFDKNVFPKTAVERYLKKYYPDDWKKKLIFLMYDEKAMKEMSA
jgi:hypothetical protein